MHKNKNILHIICLIALAAMATFLLPVTNAQAQVVAGSTTCTDQPLYNINEANALAQNGILYQVGNRIITILNTTARGMFNSIVASPTYRGALNAALFLSVALYAAMFMFGIVPFTGYDILMRLIKIGFIFIIISPTGWTDWFNLYVVSFFDGGTNQMIGKMIEIAMTPLMTAANLGDYTGTIDDAARPLRIFNMTTNMLLSPKLYTILLALPFTGPYGLVIFLLFLWGIMSMIRAVLGATWVFLMSIIAKTILYGMAPIFLSFILFERTRNLFMGWLGQIVNYSLQPLLLFTFLAFFMTLIEAALDKIMQVKVCWAPFSILTGNIFNLHWWRFDISGIAGGKVVSYDWDTPFPVAVIDVLIFIILSQLAFRYITVVLQIAKEISGGVVYLNQMPGSAAHALATLKTSVTSTLKNAILSDIRVKEAVVRVGNHNGIAIYEFSYKGREGRFRGVLAHEVEHIKGAVVRVGGYKKVNYQALGLSFAQVG